MKTQMPRVIFTIGLAAGMGLGAQACAGDPASSRPLLEPDTPAAQKRNLSDANILSLLEVANKGDIETGQLAQKRGSSPQVKQFGHQMVQEHVGMLNTGAGVALRLLVVPSMPDEGKKMKKEHGDTMHALGMKSGEEFDRAYIDYEIHMHQQVLNKIDMAMKEADHVEIRHLLEKSRLSLQQHLQGAQDVKRHLKEHA